ncbi:MAG: hypothetical protein ACOYD4_09580 [Solirubrobacterales bacterium]
MSRRLQIAAALLAVGAAAALPATGSAFDPACGEVETAQARRNVNPGGHPPLAIGDSTMLLALPALAREGYQVNAHGCRQIDEGLELLRDERRRERLPHLVVIALGADATLSSRQIEKAFHILGPKRVLGLVTPLELGGGTSGDADAVRAEAKRHPRRSVLLDWVAFSKGHGDWFQPDGLHLTFTGADGFARLLRGALPFARAGQLPGSPPTGKSGLGQHPIPLG